MCRGSGTFPGCSEHNPTAAWTTRERLGKTNSVTPGSCRALHQSGLTVQRDFEGSRRQEVSLHHVTDEEGHQTREDLETGMPSSACVATATAQQVRYLVVLSPGPNRRRVGAEERERVLTADDEEDGEELQVGDQVTDQPEEEDEFRMKVPEPESEPEPEPELESHLLSGVGG